ncbi:MAG: hypothetical protein KC419_25390 [Anaerolineales bacterium]|nr:hypothetical protein [Anaerolineales bacterium]
MHVVFNLLRRIVTACLLLGLTLIVLLSSKNALAQPAQASGIVVDNLHVALTFIGDEVQVHELYAFAETAVSTTTPAAIETSILAVAIPNGAKNPSVQQNGAASGMTMTATYRLPYKDALTLTHDIPYDVKTVTFSLPYNGVAFAADGWHQFASRVNQASGTITRLYQRGSLAAGESLTLGLHGTTAPSANGGSAVPMNTWLVAVAGLCMIVTLVYIGLGQRKTAVSQNVGLLHSSSVNQSGF